MLRFILLPASAILGCDLLSKIEIFKPANQKNIMIEGVWYENNNCPIRSGGVHIVNRIDIFLIHILKFLLGQKY